MPEASGVDHLDLMRRGKWQARDRKTRIIRLPALSGVALKKRGAGVAKLL